jgi:hypothetical protein
MNSYGARTDIAGLSRQSFEEVGLHVRQNRIGYLIAYQLFMSPISVAGYVQEAFRARRKW